MSYDVCGTDEDGKRESFSWNFTSNCSATWRLAGADIAEFAGKVASDCTPILRAAIDNMERFAAPYVALDAKNGCGTYKQLVPALKQLLAHFVEHPSATISVSK